MPLGLIAAAGSAMLGVSRVGYSLATNRQIPSAVGRLHPRWGTPFVIMGAAAVAAAALVLPNDLELLVGIYAFGAIAVVHDRAPVGDRAALPGASRERGYRVPLSVPFRGASVPLPAVLGALLSFAGWVAVLIFHTGARYVGIGWLLGGLLLYVTYRKTESKPLLRRVTIPERALRHEALEPEFGSILVPVFGSKLDDDIIQTAGRLAGDARDGPEPGGSVIEAVWVFELPLSLPLERAAARGPGDPGQGRPGPGQGGRRGIRGRDRRHHDGPGAAGGPGDRQRGPRARGGGDRAGRRGAFADPRRGAVRRLRRSA